MSRRRVSSAEQDADKPGRQTVTFLLIINLTLWLVYTFEMQKLEANPVQVGNRSTCSCMQITSDDLIAQF